MNKLRSLEDIARDEIVKYMTPYAAIGFKGLPKDVAVKKAKSNRHGHWDAIFDRVAATL